MQSARQTQDCGRFYRVSWSTLLWTFVFGGSLIAARELLSGGVVSAGLYAWLVAAVPMVLGVLLLRSYARFIAAMDELWIGIYFRSLAFSFGVSVLGLLSYPMLEYANAPPLDPFVYGGFCILVFGGALVNNARRFA